MLLRLLKKTLQNFLKFLEFCRVFVYLYSLAFCFHIVFFFPFIHRLKKTCEFISIVSFLRDVSKTVMNDMFPHVLDSVISCGLEDAKINFPKSFEEAEYQSKRWSAGKTPQGMIMHLIYSYSRSILVLIIYSTMIIT